MGQRVIIMSYESARMREVCKSSNPSSQASPHTPRALSAEDLKISSGALGSMMSSSRANAM